MVKVRQTAIAFYLHNYFVVIVDEVSLVVVESVSVVVVEINGLAAVKVVVV